MRIGYLGPRGSYSHDASVKQFGSSVSYEDLRTLSGVFEEVARGNCDYGLVPVENSAIGSVAETLDAWFSHAERVAVCAEVQLSVAHALVTCPGAVPSDIREVHSKAEALAQCRGWLAVQYPGATLVPAASSSAAVAALADAYEAGGTAGAKHRAAIGSALAAKLYDLPTLFSDIQDVTPNVTRFLVLCARGTPAAEASAPSGDDKTAVVFVCDDAPGALVDVLEVFRNADVNLTHLDKRPCSPQQLATLVSIADHKGVGRGGATTPVATVPAATVPAATVPAVAVPAATSSTVALAPSLFVPASLGGRGSRPPSIGYAFFLEASGHITSPVIAAAIVEAGSKCVALKVLGSFPRCRRVL